MDCINPTIAWMCGTVRCKSDGQVSPNLVFSFAEAFRYFADHFGSSAYLVMPTKEIAVPCGKCANCLAQKRKSMSTRLVHERSCYENVCFITLTYDNDTVPMTDNLPNDNPSKHIDFGIDAECIGYHPTLHPVDVTKFLKRLRRHLEYVCKRKKDCRDHVEHIRYFAVGEYGRRTGRPHYHIIIFNWFPSDFVDRDGHNGTSEQLRKLWPYGYHLVSKVSAATCKYCAQYVTKKLVQSSSPFDGYRCPEFTRQSTHGGGMGIPWFDKYYRSVADLGYVSYRDGTVILKTGIPKSYIRHLRKYFPETWLDWRKRAVEYATTSTKHTPEEIRARARARAIQFARLSESEVL